ncbi:MAG: 30S ribosomal protein S9 [Bacteroidetes bacterium]|nr:MAG: 30S ribosomal protein S9 [Bacteroidota bacterium]
MSQQVTVGRRKRAIARVYFNEAGTGKFEVNDRELPVYFPTKILQDRALEPFSVLELNPGQFDVRVIVSGGGVAGQAEAVRLGVARALVDINEEHRSPLKKAGFMTRDARKVERKKYGKKKARKSTQFSKR